MSSKQYGLDFHLFKEQVNRDLEGFFKMVPGQKLNVAFPYFLQNFVIQLVNPTLKEKYISGFIDFSSIKESTGSAVLAVITPADRETVEEICQTFKKVPNYTKILLPIPRVTPLVQQVIEDNGYTSVYSAVPQKNCQTSIWVHEFHADFLSIDEDFFLMPCIRTFYQVNIENDFNDLYSSARALSKIQSVYGIIPQVFTIGTAANRVLELMNGIINQAGLSSTALPQIHSLILIDRSVDMVTPLMTPCSFEGLVDEYIDINYGLCNVENMAFRFSEKDVVLREIRQLPIEAVGRRISEMISTVKSASDDIENLKNYSVVESKDKYFSYLKLANNIGAIQNTQKLHEIVLEKFFKENPQQTLVQKEMELIENHKSILDYAEGYVTIMNDWLSALRLICLESAIGVNHSDKLIKKIEKEIVSEFGFDAFESLVRLERIKLLSSQQYPGYAQIEKALHTCEPFGENDQLYEICDKIVPLTLRLVQKATVGDWPGKWGDPLKDRGIPVGKVGEEPPNQGSDEVRRILVFFIGGITLSEADYIRELGKNISGGKIQYIIGSTNKINCKELMHELCNFL